MMRRRRKEKKKRRKERRKERRKMSTQIPSFPARTKLDTYCSCSSSREVDAAATLADAEEEVGSMTDAAVSSI